LFSIHFSTEEIVHNIEEEEEDDEDETDSDVAEFKKTRLV
jgi:hypothetical protein